MYILMYAVGVSLLATALAHAECKGTCVGAWGNCLQSHFCCGDASCIKKNNYYAGCVPKGGKPGADWDGTDLTCGSGGGPPGSKCQGACLPAYSFCQDNPNCCAGTKCISTVNGNAKCWPDSRRPLFTSWDGTVLTCGEPPRTYCEGACLPAYEFCQDNPNCCPGTKCIKTVNGNAKCWPDERRPLFTSWDGGVLTCEGGASACTGPCLPAYEFCQDNPNCCAGSKCIKTVNGNAKCWPDERRPLFTSWDGGVLTCEGGASACTAPCLPAYEFCQDNPNCCAGSKCIKTVNGNAKCWPDERRPLFTSWDGGVLTCGSGGTPPGGGDDDAVVTTYDWNDSGADFAPCSGSAGEVCCETYDDDYQDLQEDELLMLSGDGKKCVIASEEPDYPPPTTPRDKTPPPRELCGYGFRKPCSGPTTVIWMRDFACQGLNAKEDCIEYCRECSGPGPDGKQKDDAVEAFLNSWVEVPVESSGCLGIIENAFSIFEKEYYGTVIRPNAQDNLRHRHVIGPNSFYEGDRPTLCVPCGWPALPVCAVGPQCDPFDFLAPTAGYCKLS